MQSIIRLLSTFLLLFSIGWLIYKPGLQPMFSCVIAGVMFLVTLIKSNLQLQRALSAIALVGTCLWAIIDFPSLEPLVAITGAALAYVNTFVTKPVGLADNGINQKETQMEKPQEIIRALEMAKRSLAILEEQAAGYPKLSTPPHLQIDLEEKRKEVKQLEDRLKNS